MDSERCDVRLAVRVEDSAGNRLGGSQYANLEACVVVLARDEHSGMWQAWDPDSYSITVPATVRDMSGLKFTAQMDDTTARVTGREWYGAHVGYESSRLIERDAAARMNRVLGQLQRRLDKFERDLGTWRHPADLLIRVALVVCDTPVPFIRHVGSGDDFEGTGYRSMSADDLRYWLDGQVKAWRDKHGVPDPE